ncbi:uncharacterized protein LOC115631591 [Scaptodrosophila lebanonensis]|uniref:Uncharacterized protein LOC115631591 n=1 Tax=Drosophila lebanonensis TaxID=7225 RepID=A0A6J2UAQ9_DROLE|nr:uncharacterized protein LOC115631591 [Scaptodrosophila lebanonensis]
MEAEQPTVPTEGVVSEEPRTEAVLEEQHKEEDGGNDSKKKEKRVSFEPKDEDTVEEANKETNQEPKDGVQPKDEEPSTVTKAVMFEEAEAQGADEMSVDTVLDAVSEVGSRNEEQDAEEKEKEEIPETSEEHEGVENVERKLTVEEIEAIERQKRKQRLQENQRTRERIIKAFDAYKQEANEALTTSTSKEVFQSNVNSLLQGTYDEMMLDELEDAESVLSLASLVSIPSNAVTHKDEFLDNFGEMIHVSDISLDVESEEEPVLLTPVLSKRRTEEDGQFVDPLTGEPDSESEEEEIETGPELDKVDIPEEEQELESSDLADFESAIILPAVTFADEADTFDVLKGLQETIPIEDRESGPTYDEHARKLKTERIVRDFIHNMINRVVNHVEYMDPREVLSKSLSIPKLYSDLERVLSEYISERMFNECIGSKVVEFFRRAKMFRALSALHPETKVQERERYRKALLQLDHLKKIEKSTKHQCSYLMASVWMDITSNQTICFDTDDRFSEVVRKTLLRKDSEHLKRVIDVELRRMINVRNQISDVRIKLISRKHTEGRLHERSAKFDQITEDLTMNHFLAVYREVQTMDELAEEQNLEITRLHSQVNKELHMLMHMREKTDMIKETLGHDKLNLQKKICEKEAMRKQLYRAEMEHGNNKKIKMEIHHQGGLLFNPKLMYDYDKTMDYVNGKRASVQKLKRVMRHLEQRIRNVEAKLPIEPTRKV